MFDSEQVNVQFDIMYFVEKENYFEQKQQMIVIGYYVFCVKVDKWDDVYFGDFLDVFFVVFCYVVCICVLVVEKQ